MDDLSLLITNDKLSKKFNRLVRAELRRHGLEITSQRDDFCYITDGEGELSFSMADEKIAYSCSRSEDDVRAFADRVKADFEMDKRMVSFTNGQNFLRITAMHQGEIGQGMIAADFVGGMKKVLCMTSDDRHARLVYEDILTEWDVPPEMLLSVADRNMSRLMTSQRLSCGTLDRGLRYAQLGGTDDFNAALMMCNGFYGYISPVVGTRFLLIAPSKDTVIAMTEPPFNVGAKFRDMVTEHNRWSSDPLTTNVYLYTSQGVEVVTHFPDI